MPFGDLFDGAEEDVIRVHRLEDAQIVTEEDGFRGRRLLSRQGRSGFELYVLELAAGAKRNAAPHSPGVTEHVLVIDGQVEAGPDDAAATLAAGDYLTFAADLPHHYHALGGPARVLLLTDYP